MSSITFLPFKDVGRVFSKTISFDSWIDKVLSIGIEKGYFKPDTSTFDLDLKYYQETYFDQEISPEDTIIEQLESI